MHITKKKVNDEKNKDFICFVGDDGKKDYIPLLYTSMIKGLRDLPHSTTDDKKINKIKIKIKELPKLWLYENGAISEECVDTPTLDTFRKYMSYGAIIRYIFKIEKFWINKNKQYYGKYECGCSIKCVRMLIEQPFKYDLTQNLFSCHLKHKTNIQHLYDPIVLQGDDIDLTKYTLKPINRYHDYAYHIDAAFPHYDHGNSTAFSRFIIITKPIKTSNIYFHKIDAYDSADTYRIKFWIMHDPTDSGNNELFEEILRPIDEYHTMKIMKEKNKDFVYFYKHGEKVRCTDLDYLPAIKTIYTGNKNNYLPAYIPAIKNIHTNTKNDYVTFITMWIDTEYDQDAKKDTPQKIKTSLFLTNADGSIKSDPEPISSLDDLIKHIESQHEIQLIFEICKFWVQKVRCPKLKILECGYKIKCRQILVLNKTSHE